MSNKIVPKGDSYIDYKGAIVAVRKSPMTIVGGDDTKKEVDFEQAFRAPGVRLIIPNKDNNGLVMTREHRREHDGYDYRLAGGKVFDKLDDYIAFLESKKDILVPGREKAIAEGGEEAGVVVKSLEHFVTARAGGTIEWDLQYWLVSDWDYKKEGQDLEHGEDIEVVEVLFADLVKLIKNGDMNEYRSVGVLARWMLEENRIQLV